MITPWTIYWLTRLDGIKETVLTGIILSAVFFVVALFYWNEGGFDKEGCPRLAFKLTIPLFVTFICIQILVPTTKEMAAILVIPAVANSQTSKELGDSTVMLAKEWLEELRPKKAEK